MIRFAMLTSLILLNSCIAPAEGWLRSDGTELVSTTLMRDKADCHMYIDASRENSSIGVPKHPVMEWEDDFVQCMRERGWEIERLR